VPSEFRFWAYRTPRAQLSEATPRARCAITPPASLKPALEKNWVVGISFGAEWSSTRNSLPRVNRSPKRHRKRGHAAIKRNFSCCSPCGPVCTRKGAGGGHTEPAYDYSSDCPPIRSLRSFSPPGLGERNRNGVPRSFIRDGLRSVRQNISGRLGRAWLQR